MAFDPDAYLQGASPATAPVVATLAPPPPAKPFDPDDFLSTTTKELVDSDEFDPVGYAIANPDKKDFAKEVAWQKSQRPMTGERAMKLPGIAGKAAVGIVKDFGAGLGNIAADTYTQATDEDPANRARASVQQAARAQLIEHNSRSFADKLFGPDSIFGFIHRYQDRAKARNKDLEDSDGEGEDNAGPTREEMLADAQTAQMADDKANPRQHFDKKFDEKVEEERKRQELLQGKLSNEGVVAKGAEALSGATEAASRLVSGENWDQPIQPTPFAQQYPTPEELAARNAPVDPEAIRTGAVASDPVNLLPLGIPKAAPILNKVAGAVLKAPVAAAAKIAENLPTKILRGGKYGLGAGVGGTIGYEALHDPSKAAEHLAEVAALGVGLRGAKMFGGLIDNAGSKLINPNFVSAAEQAGARAAMDIEAGGGGQLAKFTSGAMNKADAQRALSKTIEGAASAPLAMAPLTAATSDTPEEAAAMTGGAMGFGGLAGATHYNPATGFRPDLVKAVDSVLRDNGAKKTYGTDLDAAHSDWMKSAPEPVKDAVNAYRGFFDGFHLANGKEPQIYVLNGDQFSKEVVKRRPDLALADAKNQRGFMGRDGAVIVNGDYGGEVPGILGHEAGGHVAESIMSALAPELSQSLATKAQQGLMSKGRATPGLRKFVDAYNLEFDPTGKTKEIQTTDHAMSEWLAEQASSVLQGDGPAKFAAGESVRQKIADNLGDYFHSTFGTKNRFSREEIPAIAKEYRGLLYEMGRMGTRRRSGEVPPPAAPAEAAPEATPGREAAPAAAVSAPSAEEVNADARMKSLNLDPAEVEAARDKAMQDAISMERQRRGKRPMSEKSEAEVAEAAGKEFDAHLERYSGALESEGVPHPAGLSVTEAMQLNELAPDGNLPKWRNWGGRTAQPSPATGESADRIVEEPQEGEAYPYSATPAEVSALSRKGWTAEEISAMPKSQVDAEIGQPAAPAPAQAAPATGAPLSAFPAVQPAGGAPAAALATFPDASGAAGTTKPRIRVAKNPETGEWFARQPENQPASEPQQPAAAPETPARPVVTPEEIQARLQAAESAARTEQAGKKRKNAETREKATKQAVKEARIRALLDASTETAGEPGHLQRREENGEEKFTGRLDPENPVHDALLDELGVSEGGRDNLQVLHDNLGKVVFIDYRSSSKEVQSEVPGRGIDRTGKQRSKEYRAETVNDRLSDESKGEEQNKAFYPMGFRVNPSTGSVTVTGFSPQRLLANAGKLIQFLRSKNKSVSYTGANDPKLAEDMQGYAQNHASGFKGDGSGPLVNGPIEPVEGYSPYSIPAERFDLLNAAMANESAKTPKVNREGAIAKSKEAQQLARYNGGFLSEEGETNPLRDFINKSGDFVFTNEHGETRTGTKEILEPTIESLRVDPELMRKVSTDAPKHEGSIRPVGMADPSDVTASGIPNSKAVAGGFLPGKGGEDISSIKSKIEDDGIEPERIGRLPNLQSLTPFWIAPDGTMYDGHALDNGRAYDLSQTHVAFAEKYIAPGAEDPMRSAHDKGWLRVNVSPGDDLIMVNAGKLTRSAKQALEDLAYSQELEVQNDDGDTIIEKPEAPHFGSFLPGQGAEKGGLSDFGKEEEPSIKSKVALGEPKNLVAVHNLSMDNLRHAIKVGGLAVPSMAVIRADKSTFDGFGDVTLVAHPDLIDPKKNKSAKTFNADVYSPRYPKVNTFFKDGDGKKIVDSFKGVMDELGEASGDVSWNKKPYSVVEAIRDRGVGELKYNDLSKYAYAREKGLIEAPKKDEPIDDVFKRARIATEGASDKIPEWFSERMRDLKAEPIEKIFNGFTNSGKRRYLPHDLDTVVKIMKKELRGGEGFNYGVGSIRAKAARQFRSLEAIQKSRDSVITKSEMEDLKKEIDEEFSNLYDKAAQVRVDRGGSMGMDSFSDDLIAMAEGGSANWKHLREMYPDGIPAEMGKFLEKLKGLPTEYFETKVQRAVHMYEFAGAAVPDDAPEDITKSLNRRGITVETYKRGDASDRQRVISKLADDVGGKFTPGDSGNKTWFIRDGRRVYHRRHSENGKFLPKNQTLANFGRAGIISESSDDDEKKPQLSTFE